MLSLLLNHHFMNTLWESGGKIPCILIISTRLSIDVSGQFRNSAALPSDGKAPLVSLARRLAGHQNGF
jgi:hypothetical protein